MQPILPTGLPYALERKAVEGIVLDILGALKIGGYRTALPADYPTSVLVVHKDLIDSRELASFIEAYNQAVAEMNSTEVLSRELAIKLDLENSSAEVKTWKDMGVQYRILAMPN
jgi:ABC-type nitrate/sulfonate/bicarbonate transport system substrate-binding protein